MVKKWLTVLLGLVLASFVLAACSDDKTGGKGSDVEIPEGATEVVMWNLFGGGDAEYMQEIVDKFNESQSDIFINNIQQEYEEYYTKLLTSIASGKGPDLAISHIHVLPELVNQGLLQDLDPLAKDVDVSWDEYTPNILEATIYDDKHYAVPIDTHAQIFYYNNKLVKDAGLLKDDGTLKMEETPEGFRNFLTSLKKKLPENKYPMAFSTAGLDTYRLWWTFYTQLGGEHILTDDLENPEYALDLDKAIKAAEYLKSLYYEDKVIPLNLQDFYSEFQSQNAATISTGVWATGIWETTDDLEFTAMPVPNIFDQKGAWGNSHTFVIPYYEDADPEIQKAALEFMEFATDEGAIWAKAGHVPAKETVVNSEEFKELPYRSDYAQVAEYVNFEDRNIYSRGLRDIVMRNLDMIWTDEVSPEEAFKAIEKEVKDLIGG
ncbi:ABC transporter substrate-binding protein [Virgibacillus phasianinus]|uniref:ABC transporter substrate-binding protein n=1 Tax=Virgibacillus phasianinus TaxID=2017483 RepID=A0A220U517_9BACI|nr:ABC transporter substrate-binding protein [Virgibacillus phasianinus]ASK62823.1 ABC transporter substrate-binding protein [Virgibacillus phasianinus]